MPEVMDQERYRDGLAAEGVFLLDAGDEWTYSAQDLTYGFDPHRRSGYEPPCSAFQAHELCCTVTTAGNPTVSFEIMQYLR